MKYCELCEKKTIEKLRLVELWIHDKKMRTAKCCSFCINKIKEVFKIRIYNK